MSDSRSCGRCQYFYNGICHEESKCMRDVDEAKYYGIIEGRKQGKSDGAKSFMNFIDKHTHITKDSCEIALDDDITILFEEWEKGEK